MQERERIKQLVWLYFWLLIFEGALRRWALPSLATPLLLVREPVALGILVLAARGGVLNRSPIYTAGIGITVASLVLTMLFAHRDLEVALYGARIMFLHFPLIYVIGRVFQLTDVLRIGRVCALVALPMTLLIGAQFFLPQSHFLNIGIGGEGTAGFDGAGGRFRPPGTFSFILGVTQFYALTGAFLIAFATLGQFTRKAWWILATITIVVAIPLSMSRGLLFHLMVTGAVAASAGALNLQLVPRILLGTLAVAAAVWSATLIPAFGLAMQAFAIRWSSANEHEGGIMAGVVMDRFLGGLWSALTSAHTLPFAGFGLGLGTNAGAALRTGQREFLVAEGEWLRIVGEMGPVLGLALIGVRIAMTAGILQLAMRSWRRSNPVPLLLSSVAALWIAQGNWAQPTSLGFSVLAGGLALAATRHPANRPRTLVREERTTNRGFKGAPLE